MAMLATEKFPTVYGPVKSWRYGRSLGIDPVGKISTCSFDCVYCQLGAIERVTSDRQIFIPTDRIVSDLQAFAHFDVDVVTLSGSGEPTLALNLGDILTQVKSITQKPTVVLTNGTLLDDDRVRNELAIADRVALKIDATSPDELRRVNRPDSSLNWDKIWQGMAQFSQMYRGKLDIQTMLLWDWNETQKVSYLRLVETLSPHEIQLNVPKRPKPANRQLDGRGNHSDDRPYAVRHIKCLDLDRVAKLAEFLQQETGISVRYR